MGYWEENNDPADPRRWIWVDDPPVNPAASIAAAVTDVTDTFSPQNKRRHDNTNVSKTYAPPGGLPGRPVVELKPPGQTAAPEDWDAETYLKLNPDVANDPFGKEWPLEHYLSVGKKEGRKYKEEEQEPPPFEWPKFEMPSFTMPEWPKFEMPQLPAYPTAPTPGTSAVQAKSSIVDRSRIRKLTLLSDQSKSVAAAKLGHTSTGQTAGKRRLLG